VDLTSAFTNSKHNGRAQEGGIPRIAISEMPKRSRTAKLIMLMTAKGIFSRIRTSTPRRIEYATDKTFQPVPIRQHGQNSLSHLLVHGR
jgi:hypothetical protein